VPLLCLQDFFLFRFPLGEQAGEAIPCTEGIDDLVVRGKGRGGLALRVGGGVLLRVMCQIGVGGLDKARPSARMMSS
jgi:hypothetical protein